MEIQSLFSYIKNFCLLAHIAIIFYIYSLYNITLDPNTYQEEGFTQFASFKGLTDELRPALVDLTKTKYFRYFRVDLTKKCPFWQNESVCRARVYCEIKCPCPLNQLPQNWIQEDERKQESLAFSTLELQDFIKPPVQKAESSWSVDAVTNKMIYVDLTKDREMWTKYQGQRIWKAIYEENLLRESPEAPNSFPLYRIISGMHTSISSHLTYFQPDERLGLKKITANIPMYFDMVGNHKDRLANLIFAVRLLIRSMIRNVDYIENFKTDTGDFQEDMKTQQLLKRLSRIFKDHKDIDYGEKELFGAKGSIVNQKEKYLQYFRNITQIMDCVDCQKCKAYGKLQVIGIGLALRGLLQNEDFEPTRNEMIAFFNTLDKWIESIQIIELMKDEVTSWRRWRVGFLTIVLIGVPELLEFIIRHIAKKRQANKEKEKEKAE